MPHDHERVEREAGEARGGSRVSKAACSVASMGGGGAAQAEQRAAQPVVAIVAPPSGGVTIATPRNIFFMQSRAGPN